MSDFVPSTGLDLYWIPLGAGARVVRRSGALYERLHALVDRRSPCDLYHSALIATVGGHKTVVEMTPIPREGNAEDRGVVAEGPVGTRLARRFRVFRYEIRRWPDGVIPDLAYAVSSPVRITADGATVAQVLELLPLVPTYVWGRDELQAGDMWNSNSVVSWVLARAGVVAQAGRPPANGRAPGWDAGLVAAHRQPRRGDGVTPVLAR